VTAQPIEINVSFPPVTRATLRVYADASGDTNAAHTETEAAKSAGFDDVFAQGMLVMAYMGRAVTNAVSSDRLRMFSTRFIGITHLGDELRCSGASGEPFEQDGERRATLDLQMVNQFGDIKLTGRAVYSYEGER
jgi:acyl dehydratase